MYLASFYFTGPILIRCNVYTVIFKFNLIKSKVRVILVMYITGFVIVNIQTTCIGMDWSRKL